METETTEVQAGRELDELVAERVMGWTRPADLPAHMQGYASYDPALLSKMRDRQHWWRDAEGNTGTVPNYSTDMAAAWLVVEQWTRSGLSVQVQFDADYGIDHKSGWSVIVEGCVLTEFAPTAPLAICRAALA